MQLTHTMFIQMFIPTKKPTTWSNIQLVGYQLWAQLGSNQRPPDYESDYLFCFQNYIFLYINRIICGLNSRQRWNDFGYSPLGM